MLPVLLGDKMQEIKYGYIIDKYYKDHPGLIKILDIDDSTKHNIRTHLCLNIEIHKNSILVPLRKNLGAAIRPYGKIGYSVPSKSKPNAGLDYRYTMIISDKKYIQIDTPRIPSKQIKIISSNYDTIEKEVMEYINSFITKAKKGRINRTARFRESSLINYYSELGIDIAPD